MRKTLLALVIAAAAVPMLIGVAGLPRPGDSRAPAHGHVSERYLAVGAQETGASNIVTGVLLNYRAFDTFGEVMVIFCALAAVTSILTPAIPTAGGPGQEARGPRLAVSPVVAFIIRLMAPFIAAFGAWVILKGHVSPGGGFQGGAILGALLMLLSIVLGRDVSNPLVPAELARWLQAAAPIAFAVVAFAGLAWTGHLLGLPVEPELSKVRSVMLLVLDIGIGVGGAAVIAGIYVALRGE